MDHNILETRKVKSERLQLGYSLTTNLRADPEADMDTVRGCKIKVCIGGKDEQVNDG